MGMTGQPSWVRRIRDLLEQARAKDSSLEAFGAHSHQYKLAAPASEAKIKKFEERFGFRLPEEYREFLLRMGDGGAGPYYGLYGLEKLKNELSDNSDYPVLEEMILYPKMSDEDWDRAADPEGRRRGEEVHPYAGILPIGSQGCTLMTGLALNGPYQGQVIYYDEDFCGKPFFVREKGFLAWYERWLREVIAGYNDEDLGFGFNVGGNASELMALYRQTQSSEEKIEIIQSCYKFETLPEEQKTFYKTACMTENHLEVRIELIKMLIHFHVAGMGDEIEKLWQQGNYGEAVSIIACEGGWALKEKWIERIFEKLPELQGDGFRDACYTIKAMKDFPGVHAGKLKEALLREDLDRNSRSVLFYCIQDLNAREEILECFLDYLPRVEDPYLLIYGIQAMAGIKDRRLQELYVKLLDKYKTHENAQWDYKGSQMVLRGGSCMGASRPEGQVVSNLMGSFDYFGLNYREAWKLLMNAGKWQEWKEQQGFG